MGRDELSNGLLQVLNTAVGTTPDLALGEQGKPALDLIQPGSMGGSEVQMIAGSLLQPLPHPGRLVGTVVVQPIAVLKADFRKP